MFVATAYGVPNAPSGHDAPGVPPPSSILSTATAFGSVSGRLVQGTSEAVATLYNASGVSITAPSLLFSKPASVADVTKDGSCTFVLNAVPPSRPYFDLELTVLRTVGVAKTVNVQLSIVTPNDTGNSAVLGVFNGKVTVPAACPVATTQMVEWDDGDPVESFHGDVHNMPYFGQADASHSLPSTQAMKLGQGAAPRCTVGPFSPPTTPSTRNFTSCRSGSRTTKGDDHAGAQMFFYSGSFLNISPFSMFAYQLNIPAGRGPTIGAAAVFTQHFRTHGVPEVDHLAERFDTAHGPGGLRQVPPNTGAA